MPAPLPPFDEEEERRDSLPPLPTPTTMNRPATQASPLVAADTHLKTYTAGEDNSRLADMAREFGLQNQRQPRRQVRDKWRHPKYRAAKRLVKQVLLDPTMEDARMRAVYTSHSKLESEDERINAQQLYERMHSWEHEGGALEIEEEEEEELDVHAQGLGGSLTSAMLGVIKGMVGPAILYLPHGFANAGYATAIPLMIFSTVLFLYSSQCLLDAWKIESTRASQSNDEDDQEMASLVLNFTKNNATTTTKKHVMLSYPELAYRALGPTGEQLVKTGIALMQSGVCLTYLIFVPQNLSTSMKMLFHLNVAPEWWLVVMVLCQVPLSWIRDIRKLTPTNLLANLLILYGLLTCLGFAITQAATSIPGMGPIESIYHHLLHLDAYMPGWYLFVGTSVLLFEGSITLLVPLQESVHTAQDRARFPQVYQQTILGIICFYCFFGITCWMAFGNDLRTVFTTSLPEGYLATSVQLAYSIAVIFTFPLQNFPALEIATKTISTALHKSNQQCLDSIWTKRNVLSSLLVFGLAIIAVLTMNALDKVVSLMGSLLGCPIAFLFPPLIHSKLALGSLSPARKWSNTIVAVLGVVAMVLASAITIITW